MTFYTQLPFTILLCAKSMKNDGEIKELSISARKEMKSEKLQAKIYKRAFLQCK